MYTIAWVISSRDVGYVLVPDLDYGIAVRSEPRFIQSEGFLKIDWEITNPVTLKPFCLSRLNNGLQTLGRRLPDFHTAIASFTFTGLRYAELKGIQIDL